MTNLLIALWCVGSVAVLVIALRDWPPLPRRSFDAHADDAIRLVRHPSGLRCLVCDTRVATDIATHTRLFHSHRATGVEDTW